MKDTGEDTLNVISSADNFNFWMYKRIRKFISPNDKILEIGSGIGNISKFFINDGFDISLSDINDEYITQLSNTVAYNRGCYKIDIEDANFDTKYKSLFSQFDCVYALNVVEHINDDNYAISNLKKLLKPNGKLIILVPAYMFLFNNFDKNLDHKRRYTKSTLNKIIENNSLKVRTNFYFNAFGIIGWFIFGNILKKDLIPEGKMSFYNKLIPFFKILDFISFRKIGLSVVVVADL